MYRAIRFAWIAFATYRRAVTGTGISYSAVTENGVPQLGVMVAVDREAWRVTNLALEAALTVPKKP